MTLKFYLDTRSSEVLHPLKIRINIGKSSALIGTKIKLESSHWDAKRQRVIGRPDKATINIRISRMLFDLQDFYDALPSKRSVMAGDLKRLYEKQDEHDIITLCGLFDEIIKTKKVFKTNRQYRTVQNSIRLYSEDIDIASVTADWIRHYEEFLQNKGVSINSRRQYLSILCAVCNYAVREDIIAKSPFIKFKMPKTGNPRKRALTTEQIQTLLAMSDYTPAEKEAIDVFFLIFTLIGINFIDLTELNTIHNGRVEYDRHKTKRAYSIKVFPEAQRYIDEYRGDKSLIKIHSIGYINKLLGIIGRRILGFPITTYWARHSWASIAINDCDIDKDTISYALGHTLGSHITAIYIDFNLQKVDQANRKVLDLVFGKSAEKH